MLNFGQLISVSEISDFKKFRISGFRVSDFLNISVSVSSLLVGQAKIHLIYVFQKVVYIVKSFI